VLASSARLAVCGTQWKLIKSVVTRQWYVTLYVKLVDSDVARHSVYSQKVCPYAPSCTLCTCAVQDRLYAILGAAVARCAVQPQDQG
jgi:hypothetical protein